jgi:hypothetical protein
MKILFVFETNNFNQKIMKNYLSILVLVLFLFPKSAIPQTENAPTMMVMWENEIPPSMVLEYEKVVIKESELYRKLKYPRSYFVYQTDDYHYWWVMIIKDIGDFEKINQEMGNILVKMEKEEGFVFGKEFQGKTNFVKPMIFQWLPILSNMPDGTMKFSQPQYFRWGLCYIKFGFEDKLVQNWEKWIDLFKENQLEIGWNLYTGIIGTENPFFVWAEFYDSPLDMATKRAKAYLNITNQSDKLWNESLQYLRKIEYKTGWYRPDLSYIYNN